MIVTDKTGTWFLRGTVWTGAKDRATRYASEQDARNAIANAAKFNPKASRNAKVVVES